MRALWSWKVEFSADLFQFEVFKERSDLTGQVLGYQEDCAYDDEEDAEG